MRRVLVPLPPTHWGGLQTFAATIAEPLRAAGWEWVTVVPEEAVTVISKLRDAGVIVVPTPLARFRRSIGESLRTFRRLPGDIDALARIGREHKVELVQAVGAHHYHGPLAAQRLKLPLVWQLHSTILPGPLRKLVAPVIRARSSAIMTNGMACKRAFFGERSLGDRHFVFYAPVDPVRFRPDPAQKGKVRQALGLPDDAVVVATVGNRVWQKNHELLVQVAAATAAHYPRLRYVIFGAVDKAYDETYRKTVVAPAEALNATRPGYVTIADPGTDVPGALNDSDLFILTSHAEGIPIALFEAMATGLPAISTKVGSIAEILSSDDFSALAAPGDSAALAAAVERFLGDNALRAEAGRRARAHIVDHFTVADVVEAHRRAYDRALA